MCISVVIKQVGNFAFLIIKMAKSEYLINVVIIPSYDQENLAL